MADSLGFAVRLTADTANFTKSVDDAAKAVERQSARAVKALKEQRDAYGILRNSQGQIVEGLSKWQKELGYYVDELGVVRTANDRFVDGLTTLQKKIGMEVDALGNVYNKAGEVVGNTGKGLKEFADAEKDASVNADALKEALAGAINDALGDNIEKMQRDLLGMSGAFSKVKGGFDALLGGGNAISKAVDDIGKLSQAIVGIKQAGETIGQAVSTVKELASSFRQVGAQGQKAGEDASGGMGEITSSAAGASKATAGVAASLGRLATGIGTAIAVATILDKIMKNIGGTVVFDPEKQRAAQEYADKFKAIEASAKAAGASIKDLSDALAYGALKTSTGTALDEALADYKETLQRGFSTASRREVEQEWQLFGDTLTEGLAKFLDNFTGNETEKIEQERAALYGLINERIKEALPEQKAESERTQELIHDLQRSLSLIDDDSQIKRVNDAIAQLTTEYNKQVEQEQANQKQEILKRAGLDKYIKAQEAAALSLDNARAKAAEWYELANSGKISWGEYQEAITAARDELRAQLSSATGYELAASTDKTKETLDALKKALDARVISEDEYTAALRNMQKTAAQELASAQGLDLDAADKLAREQRTTADLLQEWVDKLAKGDISQEDYNKAASELARLTSERVKQLERETGVSVAGESKTTPQSAIVRQLQESQEKWRQALDRGDVTQEQYNAAVAGLAQQARDEYARTKTTNDAKAKASQEYERRVKELAELAKAGVIDQKELRAQEREAQKKRNDAIKAASTDPAAQSALASLRQQADDQKRQKSWRDELKAQVDAVKDAHIKGLATQAEVREAERLYSQVVKQRTRKEQAEAQRATRDAARQELGVDSIMESLKTPLQKFNETIAKLNDAAGYLSFDEYAAVYQKALKDFSDASEGVKDATRGESDKGTRTAGASITAGSDAYYKALVNSLAPTGYETTMKDTTRRIYDATTTANNIALDGNALLLQIAQGVQNNGLNRIGVFG